MIPGASSTDLFDVLVERYSADLYRYAFWVCDNRQTAEDAVQETFLKIWKNSHQLRELDAAKSWIFTIFHREHARLYEKKSVPLVSIDDVAEPLLPSCVSNSVTHQYVHRALSAIPRDYSEPLVLQVVGGFSADEIAIILEISRSNVLTRLFRARKKLGKILARDVDQGVPVTEVYNL